MFSKVMVTGIPGPINRFVDGAHGGAILYDERIRLPRKKRDFLREMRAISNTGNYLIGEAALRCIAAPIVRHIPFWHLANNIEKPELFEELRSRFDVCVFSAANLLRKGLNAEMEARVIQQLGLPIIVVGIGIQSRIDLAAKLPPGTEAFLDYLSENPHHVMTRGQETAEYLRSRGIRNVYPAGCPSMFLFPEQMMKSFRSLEATSVESLADISFSGYLGSTTETISDINALVPATATASYVMQDEFLHYGVEIDAEEDDQVYDVVSGMLTADLSFKKKETLLPEITHHAFFDTTQWRTWCLSKDLFFGRRFHGCIIAMQAGIPAVMLAVDDRMKEMLGQVGFPKLDVNLWDNTSDKRVALETFLRSFRAEPVISMYQERRENFAETLRKVGLA